ncbi:MAG: cell division protein FtsA [Candidatus Paceibacterota bacterium]
MSFFSGSKKRNELTLVFNIGSSSVTGAFFEAQSSGIPKIIFSVRESIKVGKRIDVDRFLLLTIQALETVVNKVYEARIGAPTRIFCVLSSPWCVSQTRMINLKKNTPFIFTEKLADELIQKEIKLFEEEYSVKYSDADNSVRMIELKNIKTMLNGYETPKPLGQKTKELEMVIYISISGERILKKIEDTIQKYFHLKQMRFCSFALSSFTVARDMYAQQENFLLVDIGGEVTDIAMAKKNILRESISFPLGRNFLTRGVASGLGCTLGEANSLISLLKDGHAEASVAKKLTAIMDKLRTEWLKKFQESLVNLSNDVSIPETIYIVIDKDVADFFSETIKTEQFSQYTLTESKFKVIFLSTELLHDIAIFKENIIREPFIIIDSIYINRFLIHPFNSTLGGKTVGQI